MSRKSGVLSRHRHPLPVHGFVLKGEWRYLEHDWVATEGGYLLKRLWRGVTDWHVIDHKFLVSAEGRKLHSLMQEQAAAYATQSRLVSLKVAAAEQELAQHLSGMGIPPDGWRMKLMDGVPAESSVTDRHRPVMGGVQLQVGHQDEQRDDRHRRRERRAGRTGAPRARGSAP